MLPYCRIGAALSHLCYNTKQMLPRGRRCKHHSACAAPPQSRSRMAPTSGSICRHETPLFACRVAVSQFASESRYRCFCIIDSSTPCAKCFLAADVPQVFKERVLGILQLAPGTGGRRLLVSSHPGCNSQVHIVHEVQRHYIQRLRAAILKKLKQQG